MNRNYIDMHLVVDRYLQGTLIADELNEFEERLVWDKELLDEVDLAQQLRSGLLAKLDKNETAAANELRMRDRLRHFFAVPTYAAAASFMLGLFMTSTAFFATITVDNSERSPQSTEIVPIFATRGASPNPVSINTEAWMVLLVDVPPGFRDYQVIIKSGQTGELLWQQDGLAANYLDTVSVGLPGRILSEGQYRLLLAGAADGQSDTRYQPIQEIPFTATPR